MDEGKLSKQTLTRRGGLRKKKHKKNENLSRDGFKHNILVKIENSKKTTKKGYWFKFDKM